VTPLSNHLKMRFARAVRKRARRRYAALGWLVALHRPLGLANRFTIKDSTVKQSNGA
jgi:hypothetical protein